MKTLTLVLGFASIVFLTGCEEGHEHHGRGGYRGGAYDGNNQGYGYGQGGYYDRQGGYRQGYDSTYPRYPEYRR